MVFGTLQYFLGSVDWLRTGIKPSTLDWSKTIEKHKTVNAVVGKQALLEFDPIWAHSNLFCVRQDLVVNWQKFHEVSILYAMN